MRVESKHLCQARGPQKHLLAAGATCRYDVETGFHEHTILVFTEQRSVKPLPADVYDALQKVCSSMLVPVYTDLIYDYCRVPILEFWTNLDDDGSSE